MLKIYQSKNSKRDRFFCLASLCLIICAWTVPALALNTNNTSSNTLDANSLEFGGPSSVGETISKDIAAEARGEINIQPKRFIVCRYRDF